MTRTIKVLQKVLDANDRIARENREEFRRRGTVVVNMMSGPGAGKTSILERTITEPALRRRVAVIEGDVATTADAERIAACGVPVVQINTENIGGTCHLEAGGIRDALAELPDGIDLLFIENVGNLVCPAEFDLGETARVAVLSVTEGEDKPIKYPIMFRAVDLVLLAKVDLLPHLRVDTARLLGNIRQVNPALRVVRFSAVTGEGLDEWLAWLGGLAVK